MDRFVGRSITCEEILAAMGKFVAVNLAHRACREIPRLFGPSDSIWSNASREFLSAVNLTDIGDIPTPAKALAERQRSALEALLASVVPVDAASMSTALINEFKSLNRVFDESEEAIQRIVGHNQKVTDLLRAAQNALVESLGSRIQLRQICTTDQRLIDYLVMAMGSKPVEQLRVLFLDRSNRLIADELVATGSLTTITAYPRNLFKRAFELTASAILLVHNHPSGNVEPSKCDVKFTHDLVALGKPLEVDLRDHIIIAGSKWFSFLRQGLI